MWGNLAKKLGEVVAPSGSPGDYEEAEEEEVDDGEYSYEEGDDFEDDEEEEDRNESRGFNFVSMIARAMDSEQQQYESTSQSNLHFQDGITDESEGAEEEVDFENNHGDVADTQLTSGWSEDVSEQSAPVNSMPEPPRMALIRESGSLSPKRTAPKPSIGAKLDVPLNHGNTTELLLDEDDDNNDDRTENQSQNHHVSSKAADPLLGNFSGVDTEQRNNSVDRTASEERFKSCSADVGPVSPLRKYKSNALEESIEDTAFMRTHQIKITATDEIVPKTSTAQDDNVVLNSEPSPTTPETLQSQLPSVPFEETSEAEDMNSNHVHEVAKQQCYQQKQIETADSKPLPLNNGTSSSDAERIAKLEKRCKELRKQLTQAENHVLELQKQATIILEQDSNEHEQMMKTFQEKESRLLQAAAEEREQEINLLRKEMEERLTIMQNQLIEERKGFEEDRVHMDSLLNEANKRVELIERKSHEEKKQNDKSMTQLQQQHSRAIQMVEDKLAQTLAILDEREDTIMQLRAKIKTLESKMSEHHEGAQEAEEEMDELHAENETLRDQVQNLQAENLDLRGKNSKLQGDAEKLSHLKMELRMLKEENEREKARAHNVVISAESNSAQLLSERDELNAKIHDLQLQLAAALADVEVARSDADRIMIANGNLQAALEAFQAEREAEITLIENNQREQEKALDAAHAVALEATRETHRAEIRQIQEAADAAVKNSMSEIKLLEEKIEMMRIENVQTRRSLDEAIKRLQATQDDVVDRAFMKNILLDWLTKTEKKERGQVLEIMASVLHFTDEEKHRVHIDDGGGIRKFVAPPPPKANLEHLEGDNVREKWVNFLIAETED